MRVSISTDAFCVFFQYTIVVPSDYFNAFPTRSHDFLGGCDGSGGETNLSKMMSRRIPEYENRGFS
jgi:hypothetical protein